jgi:hypothetical protein
MEKETVKVINPIGSGNPDISIVDAAIVQLGLSLQETKKELDTQRSESKGIIIGVLVALVLVVGTVAVEVMLSNKKDAEFYSELEKNIYEQSLKVQDLNNKVDNIKTRNPYLK